MARDIPGPYDPDEMRLFLDTFHYGEEAFLIDEITELDVRKRQARARMDTNRFLPFARYQRVRPGHPGHVSGSEIIMATANLGCLHAWFFHGCRWSEGWVAFGTRIQKAEFKNLALVGPPLELRSREIRSRVGPNRTTIRFEFEFSQKGNPVYLGDQTATLLKHPSHLG